MGENILYKTSNVDLASALLCKGYDILGINDVNPQKIEFLFDNDLEIHTDTENYWRGDLVMDVKAAFNTRRDLLNRIKESKKLNTIQNEPRTKNKNTI